MNHRSLSNMLLISLCMCLAVQTQVCYGNEPRKGRNNETTTKHNCPFCPTSFSNESEMKKHTREVHVKPPTLSGSSKSNKDSQ